MSVRGRVFTTVHSEGALLPPDFLQRLVEGAKGIDSLSPEPYHLVAANADGHVITPPCSNGR